MRLLFWVLLAYALYFLVLVVFDLVTTPLTFMLWLWVGLGFIPVTVIVSFLKYNLLQALGYLILGPLLLFTFVRTIPGYEFSGSQEPSNLPSIKPGDIVVARITNIAPSRGEMITFKARQPAQYEYTRKRVHGIPGDSILVCDGVTYVNNFHFSVENNWLPVAFDPAKKCNSQRSRYFLDENEFFVLGDNQQNSFDSRNFGPIQRQQIRHTALYAIHADSPFWGSPHVTFLKDSFVIPER